jgi:hypothetical protein
LTSITLRCDLLELAVKRFAQDGIGFPLPLTKMVLQDERQFTREPNKARPEQQRENA